MAIPLGKLPDTLVFAKIHGVEHLAGPVSINVIHNLFREKTIFIFTNTDSFITEEKQHEFNTDC